MLQAYRQHVTERAALSIPPLPLSAQQTADMIELLKNPPAGEEADPERTALTAERSQALSDALASISADQRAAIVLYDVEGYDYAEIAEMTGVSLGTVKSRIHRGRLALRALLDGRMELFRG